MASVLGVGIIGCGLIGQKRAKALGKFGKVVACADLDEKRTKSFGSTFGATLVTTDWREVIESAEVDVVVVATTNNVLAEISEAAAERGKAVLVEKPAGRSVDEIDRVIAAAARGKVPVRVGFNHRYHPGFIRALELVRDGSLGDLMFVRARYGHGGRVGYDREWRADPKLSGGGELIDQGVHLIDLSRAILGEFTEIKGHVDTLFWDMPVDDNAFMILKSSEGRVAHLHVSCSEWKNLFSFEIYGKTGKLHLEGLGGSYGIERLSWYRMLPEMGPPETTIWEYPRGDNSWELEFEEFAGDIAAGRTPAANLHDARAALVVVEELYRGTRYDHKS